MTITAALLLLVSAFTHAGWNLLGKKNKQSVSGFFIASFLGLIILLPTMIIFRNQLFDFTSSVWLSLLLAGFFQAVYFGSLSAAYSHGDMSITYPLARSLPVIFVTIITVILGNSSKISLFAYIGIVLIVAGSLILPMKHFRDFSIKKYFTLNSFFALLAALGTTGYSLTDNHALSLVRKGMAEGVPSWQGSVVYAFMEGVSSFLWLAVFILLRKNGIKTIISSAKSSFRSSLFMGAGIYLTYTIVLISMAFVSDVSYVVAFRQASIPIGVIFSVLLLKEKAYPTRFSAVFIMFIGLVLVGTG
jgi:drug/metabolite transporter (DMT)-like permease